MADAATSKTAVEELAASVHLLTGMVLALTRHDPQGEAAQARAMSARAALLAAARGEGDEAGQGGRGDA